MLEKAIDDVRRRSVWRVLAVYLVGAAVGYQIVQSLTEGLGFPAWFPGLAAVLSTNLRATR